MNRVFRTIWSIATQAWRAVSELAPAAGKQSSKSQRSGALAVVILGLALPHHADAQAPPAATQLPTGGVVARGVVTISQTSTTQAATMAVNQSSQRAVVKWGSFNLGSAATLNFVQPNAQAVTLNRVNDSNPSQIFGRINANGQVFITNSNGVYFAPGSSVDVGALTATTHSISDDNFMAANYAFERNGASGKIINEGHINAALGGYVALLAPEVQNSGVVVARAGTVAMAAGELITLKIDDKGSLAGITTTPSTIASLIENKQAVQAPDGQIILSSLAVNKLQGGIIRNSGSLEANSLVSKGGKIFLEGDDITLASTSKIDANGKTGGGTVLVGGDWQGSGDMRQATRVTMEAGASIDASAIDRGDGGKVVLWSDVHNPDSQTIVHGKIRSEAGSNGGNGGAIETSGHYLNVDDIQVSTQATKGEAGKWLLDPYDVTISTSATVTETLIGGVYTPSGSASNILNTALQTALASGNVEVSTTGSGAQTGNIKINTGTTITWSSANTLKLSATGEIYGYGNITRNGSGALIFNQEGNSTNTGVFSGGYAGVVSGTGSVTKSGAGTLLVSGSNTYTGATLVNTGTLKAGTASSLGSNSAVTVASGATLNLNGKSIQIGSLSGAGTINLDGLSGGALTIGGDNGTADFSGNIASTLFGTIKKVGTGTQTLSGPNTFTSTVSVSNGTLKLGAASDGTKGPLGGVSTATVYIDTTGTLDLNGYSPIAGRALQIKGTLLNSGSDDVTWSGTIVGTTASIISTGGTINLIGTATGNLGRDPQTNAITPLITLGGKVKLSGLINVSATEINLSGSGTQFTYAPTSASPTLPSISGTGDLILNPTNTLTMGNIASTYSGGFTVAGGVVKTLSNANFGAATNTITVNDGSALSLGFSATSASPFSRNITVNGYGNGNYGALDLSSTNGDLYYSGTLSLEGTTRISETGNWNIRVTGTIQTSGNNYVDATLPHLITTTATVTGGGSQKSSLAFVGAYDAAGNYSSTYGSAASLGYQLYTSAAATTTTSVAGISGIAAFTSSGSALSATSAAGSYSLTYSSGLSSATYAFFPITAKTAWTIAKAPLTVTADAASKTYDGQTYSGGNGVTYSGWVNNQSSSVLGGSISYSGTSQGAIDAGTYVITPSGLTSSNYNITYADGTLTVNKAPLTVTATAASKTYDGQAYSGGNGVSYSGWVNNEGTSALGGSVSYSGTSQSAIDAGTYVITPSGHTSTNYDITYADGALTVNKAPLTVTAKAASKTFDGQAYSGGNGVDYSGLVNNEGSGVLGGTVTYSGTSQGAIDAGTYVITPSGHTSTNYDITYANGALTVNKAPLTVTATAARKTYDGRAYSGGNGVDYNGFVNNEGSGVLGGTVAYSGTSQGAISAGTYVITPGGLTSTNYDISYASGALTITAAQSVSSAKNFAGIENKIFEDKSNSTNTISSPQQTIEAGHESAAQVAMLGKFSMDTIPAEEIQIPHHQSGLLAVTFFEGSAGAEKSSSISFEQNADMISLESSDAKTPAVAAEKLTFSGKLTPFLVATSSGEMVEYQGGIVNNHIVIVATSNEAKIMARENTKVVLASAVTMLGKGDYIVLAQLDGVIIDMR